MEVKDSCMTYPWTLLWPHDIMLLHLMSLTQNKHVCRRHWRERQSCLSAKLWLLSLYSLTSEILIGPQRSITIIFTFIFKCWPADAAGDVSLKQTTFCLFQWNKLKTPREHIEMTSNVNVGGGGPSYSGGREAAVGVGMGSWQQFRCLLIMCQLLRWTRGRTRRGPRTRFITINKQRSHLACICDSGVTQRLQKRCRVLVQWVRNPTKVI